MKGVGRVSKVGGRRCDATRMDFFCLWSVSLRFLFLVLFFSLLVFSFSFSPWSRLVDLQGGFTCSMEEG